jgi:hypothetical protein
MQEKIKSVYRWFGLFIGIIALAYFLNSALKQISIFPTLQWGLEACGSVVATTLLSGLVTLIGGYSWILLLRSTGETLTISKGLVIFTLAQFAKYIPGNVAHHAGRIALARNGGLAFSEVVFSMVIEASWLIIAASVLATAWLFLVGDGLFEYAKGLPTLFQLAASIAAACLFALLAGGIIFYWRPGPLKRIISNGAVSIPSLPVLLTCLSMYTVCFLLMGAAANILAQYLLGASGSHILLLTGAFSIAWVAGFLTPGAPAGIGVREAILLKILTPIYGAGIAVGLTISLRAITTLTDGLTFLAALIAKGKIDADHQ